MTPKSQFAKIAERLFPERRICTVCGGSEDCHQGDTHTYSPSIDLNTDNRRRCEEAMEAVSQDHEKELYDAYLLGCEDECIPEPKTFEQFIQKWKGYAPTPRTN